MPRLGSRSAPTAQTSTGPIRGTTSSDRRIAELRGIPYAAPPVGDLRWRPPRPHEPWSDERACTKCGPRANQRNIVFERFFELIISGLGWSPVRRRALAAATKLAPTNETEDCLTLNIRAPRHAADLPIMVCIHGGDHTDGSGADPIYRSDVLPQRGCVLVTLNYRLGLFGFFAHPALSAESDDGVSGNYELLGQIAVLEWVRDNIEAFGGDPTRVTIFGESAGGAAVLNLMTSLRARGLFQRVIAQSPGDSARWLHLDQPMLDFDPALRTGARFAELASGSGASIGDLRAIDAETLSKLGHPELGRAFYPVVDGVVLPTAPMTAFSRGEQAPVPLIIGYTADEGTLLAPFMHPAGAECQAPSNGAQVPADEIRATFEGSYPSVEHVDRLFAAYAGLAVGDLPARIEHCRDHMFGVHVDHVSRCHGAPGHPVYRYHSRAEPASPDNIIGAFRAADVLYLFDRSLPLVPTADDAHLLIRDMGDRWFAFAATGVPDSPGRERWPRYEPDEPLHMVFGRPRSHCGPCPAEEGLDLMHERIRWLDEQTLSSTAVG